MAPPYTKAFKARFGRLQRRLGRKPTTDDLKDSLGSLLSTKDPETFFDGYWFLDSEFLKARDHDAAVAAAEIAVRFRRDPMTLTALSGRLYFAGRKAEAKTALAEAVDLAFQVGDMFVYASLAQIRHHLSDDDGDGAKTAFQRLMSKLSTCAASPHDPLETDVIPGLRRVGVPGALLLEYERLAASQRSFRRAP